jgi:hypothetical protein
VQGAKLSARERRGSGRGIVNGPGSRLISAGITALVAGLALGLPAALGSLSMFAVMRAERIAYRDALGWQDSVRGGLHVVRLETVAWSVAQNRGVQSEQAMSANRRASSPENVVGGTSFDERFAGAFYFPRSRSTPENEERSNDIALGLPELGGPAAAAHLDPSVRDTESLPRSPPNVSNKRLRVAETFENAIAPSDADGRAAIYDIAAHTVYLPNGQKLEAHSGLGSRLDDPRYVSSKDRGPTPPHVYDLGLREELFHGVRAIRLIPLGNGNMFGRDGILAHSYMLGPNGQSNGCVAFRDYPRFLNAFLSGEINRLVVVEHLATKPGPQAASERPPETVKALFGQS